MSEVTLTFDGLDEFKAKLTVISNEYAATAEKHLTRAGNKLKKLARENTPDSGYEHKSKLKKSWKSEIVGTKGSIRISPIPEKNLALLYNEHGVVTECVEAFPERFAYRAVMRRPAVRIRHVRIVHDLTVRKPHVKDL